MQEVDPNPEVVAEQLYIDETKLQQFGPELGEPEEGSIPT